MYPDRNLSHGGAPVTDADGLRHPARPGLRIAVWLRGPLRTILEDRLSPGRVTRRGLFEPAMVTRLIAEHVSGRRNHRKLLWTLLMFDAWCDHYLPNERWR